MELLIGLLFVTLAGLGTGVGAWPMKVIKDFQFPQFLFVFILSALIVYPWIVILINVPDPLLVIQTTGIKTLLIANLASTCWGVANVLYLICVIRIGAALSGAILSALGMSVGVIMPMILKGTGMFSHSPGLFSPAGVYIVGGLLVLLGGVILASIAGFGRDKFYKNSAGTNMSQKSQGGFLQGLILLVLAGILSCGLSLSFVYGQGPIIEAVKQQGAGELTANLAVWALGAFGGAMVNIGYAAFMMSKTGKWKLLFSKRLEFPLALISGVQFMISIVFLGRGMVFLGALGASIGFGIQQSMQIIGAQLLGFISGEWHGVYGKPRNIMYIAVAVILIAVCILAYSNMI